MTGPMDALSSYGPWAMGGTIALLAAFFLLRGRIRIDNGWAGFNVTRFSGFERFVHWLLALSFIILALTGLSLRHGRTLLAPLLGDQGYAEALRLSRTLHGMVAFAFMASLVLAFLLWVRHSLPHWRDAVWVLKGGGMIVRGSHPPTWRFNAGQKLLFWLVVVGGALLSVSGIAMLFPAQAGLLAKIVGLLNLPGLPLPTGLTPQQEVQYAALWHSAAALVLICAAIIHIFVRTIGIQGAFSAMAWGAVDANWARQQHRLWAERELEKMDVEAPPKANGARIAPAE
jgi:formate dehydrogenase subunit gamma